jgi:hypothetical protein
MVWASLSKVLEPNGTLRMMVTYLILAFLYNIEILKSEFAVKDVVDKIHACENLKYLELEGNTLGVDAAKAIGKALKSKPEFEAALWRDLFTSRLKNEIPQAMVFIKKYLLLFPKWNIILILYYTEILVCWS